MVCNISLLLTRSRLCWFAFAKCPIHQYTLIWTDFILVDSSSEWCSWSNASYFCTNHFSSQLGTLKNAPALLSYANLAQSHAFDNQPCWNGCKEYSETYYWWWRWRDGTWFQPTGDFCVTQGYCNMQIPNLVLLIKIVVIITHGH